MSKKANETDGDAVAQKHLIAGALLNQTADRNRVEDLVGLFKNLESNKQFLRQCGSWKTLAAESPLKTLPSLLAPLDGWKDVATDDLQRWCVEALEIMADSTNTALSDIRHDYRHTSAGKLTMEKLDTEALSGFPNLEEMCLWSLTETVSIEFLPPQLRRLDLRNAKKLTSLCSFPPDLETLDLTGCASLTELPAGYLPKLKYVYLGGCVALTTETLNRFLSQAINWKMLEELELFGCVNVRRLDCIVDAKALRILDAHDCAALDELPELENLTTLEHLMLAGCVRLINLPRLPIGRLQTLTLHGCRKIRRYLEDDLNERHLGAGPLSNVARDFVVKTKCSALGPGENRPRCKMILLGSGRAGKTCFAKAVQWRDMGEAGRILAEAQAKADNTIPELQPCKGEITTHGINQWEWTTDLPDIGPALIRLWDFGGQEIYHGTHQTFASTGALFVIALPCVPASDDDCPPQYSIEEWREINRAYPAEYWMEYICQLDPKALVVLLHTRTAEGEWQPERQALDERWPGRIVAELAVASLEEWETEGFGKVVDRMKGCLAEAVENEGIAVNQVRFAAMNEAIRLTRASTSIQDEHALKSSKDWLGQLRGLEKVAAVDDLLDEDLEEITRELDWGGEVFRMKNGTVILNQPAALEEIYRLLDYANLETRPLRNLIKADFGRFDAATISEVFQVGDDSGLAQQLFDFMEQCRICVRVYLAGTPGQPCLALDPSLLPIAGGDAMEQIDQAFRAPNADWTLDVKEYEPQGRAFSAAAFRDMAALAIHRLGMWVQLWKNGFQLAAWDAEDPLAFRFEWVGEPTDYAGKLKITSYVRQGSAEPDVSMFPRITDLMFGSDSPMPKKFWPDLMDPEPSNIDGFIYDIAISVRRSRVDLAEKIRAYFNRFGLRVFVYTTDDDHRNLNAIYQTIRKARWTLLLVSADFLEADFNRNHYTLRELVYSINKWCEDPSSVGLVYFRNDPLFPFSDLEAGTKLSEFYTRTVKAIGAFRDGIGSQWINLGGQAANRSVVKHWMEQEEAVHEREDGKPSRVQAFCDAFTEVTKNDTESLKFAILSACTDDDVDKLLKDLHTRLTPRFPDKLGGTSDS